MAKFRKLTETETVNTDNEQVSVAEPVETAKVPEATTLELSKGVVDFILLEAEKIEGQIQTEINNPNYKALVAQRKDALERFNTLKTALSAAEKDFIKADNAVLVVDSQINMAKSGASKMQIGFLRGLVVASGIDAQRLGSVSLKKEGDKHFIQYELKDNS